MKDYQKRVINERNDLNTKLERLNAFLDDNHTNVILDELERLRKQTVVMQQYLEILDKRIEAFK